MVNAPWYIRNNDLHKDLQVDVVSRKIQKFAHSTNEDSTIVRRLRPYSCRTNTSIVRRLQRKKPFELV
jgi:hypothetical protein